MILVRASGRLTLRYYFAEEFHKECGSSCVPNVLEPLNGVFNPLAIPLLNGWTRSVYVLVCTVVSVCIVFV